MIAQIQHDDDKRVITAGAYAITDNQLFRYGKPVMMDTEFESVYACLHCWHMERNYNPEVIRRIENAMHEAESVTGVFGMEVNITT
jgi:hypothetical protein